MTTYVPATPYIPPAVPGSDSMHHNQMSGTDCIGLLIFVAAALIYVAYIALSEMGGGE